MTAQNETSGAEAIVESLKRGGVDTIFGLPGVQLDELFNVLHHNRGSIRLILPRHEQAAAYMAMGYALATGRLGVCLVVPGPGLLNTSAALATAYGCNAPVLCLTGQIASPFIGEGYGELHEVEDQLGMMSHVTKWQGRVSSPPEAPGVMGEAIRQAMAGRPRPVVVETPPDVLMAKAALDWRDFDLTPSDPLPDRKLIDAAAELLADATHPLVYAGGGTIGAAEELKRLAETLSAPVIMSPSGAGAIDYRHPRAHNHASGVEFWPDADLVLAVGTRFVTPARDWSRNPDTKLIRIDADPRQTIKPWPPDVHIVSTAAAALDRLCNALSGLALSNAWQPGHLSQLKSEAEANMRREMVPSQDYVTAMRAAMPEDGIVCFDMMQVGYQAWWGYPAYAPRTVILLVTVVFNDGAYGSVKRYQELNYNAEYIACDLENPDFVALAEIFGVRGMRAESPEELTAAIRQALEMDRPVLIDVPMGEMPTWRDFAPSR